MKIAHVTPAYFSDASLIGGGERYVGNVVSAIRVASEKHARSLTQEVICIGSTASSCDIDGIRHTFLRNDSPSAHAMAAIPDALWGELSRFDVVHVYQSLTYFGAFAGCLAKDLGKKLVYTDLGGGQNPLMLSHGGLHIADGVISLSRFANDLLGATFSGPKQILIGPIDTDYFKPDFNVRRNRKSILCVGRLLPHKGIDRIIRALPEGFELTVVGRPYNADYLDLLKSLAKGKLINFKTNATDADLVRLYSEAGAFVHAATHIDCYGNRIRNPELMGLSTLEALACGAPVSVANSASLPELAPTGPFFRTFNDEAELHQQLLDLEAGIWGDAWAQAQATIFAKVNYSLESVGLKFIEFYESI